MLESPDYGVERQEAAATRVIVVAAYAAVRAGLHAMLSEMPGLAVIGEVSGSAEMERLAPGAGAAAAVFDDNDRDRDHVIAAAEASGMGLVVLADGQDALRPLAGSALTGWACLTKDADAMEIAAAVASVAAGLAAIDRGLAALLAGQTSGPAPDRDPGGEALTPREREVLQAMAQGLPNKAIAARLGISQHTVKFHVASILGKLGASSRTEAVTLGARRGHVAL